MTKDTRKLEFGGWYLVADDIAINDGSNLVVDYAANLILADGASLTISDVDTDKAAIAVESEGSDTNAVVIYGQRLGTGRLTARGGAWAAGIGGGFKVKCGYITVCGGTVEASGGDGGAGIGGGYVAGCDLVTITGGKVTAHGQGGGANIGCGGGVSDPVEIRISGGIFAQEPQVAWVAEGYEKVANPDPATKDAYPWAVVSNLGPTCEGGAIAKVGGVWVITPGEGVTEITVENLPEGETVAVKLNGYIIPAAAFMGFGTGESANVFSLTLNPEGVVDGVPVRPTIGDLDAGEPFTVGETAQIARMMEGLICGLNMRSFSFSNHFCAPRMRASVLSVVEKDRRPDCRHAP